MYDKTILYSAADRLADYQLFKKNETLSSLIGVNLQSTPGLSVPASDPAAGQNGDSTERDPARLTAGQDGLGFSVAALLRSSKAQYAAIDSSADIISRTGLIDVYYGAKTDLPKTDKGNVSLCLPSATFSINSRPEPSRFDGPNIAFFMHSGDAASLPRRDTEVVSVFTGGVSSLEMSRCVPYLNLEFVSLSERFSNNKVSKLSLSGYLKDDITESQRSNNPNFYNPIPSDFDDFSLGGVTKNKSFAGMELFTAPQTVSNPDGLRGVNKFAPFMTLNSCDIQLQSAGQAFYSYKTAKLKLTLHDRTRMPEVAPLLAVDLFAQNYVVLEYGWSHPEGFKGSTNDYGKLLGNMRCRELYTVVSTGFNMSSESAGSVTIDLNLSMMPAEQIKSVSAATGNSVQISLIKSALAAVMREESSENKVQSADVQQQMPIKLKNVSSSNTMIPRKSLVELLKVSSQATFNKEEFSRVASGIIAGIDASKSSPESIRTILMDRLTEVRRSSVRASSPFDKRLDVIRERIKLVTGGIKKEDYLPLSSLVYAFLGVPLAACCKFDEVQVHFYPANVNALGAANINVGDFPVPVSVVETAISQLENPSCYSLIRTIIELAITKPSYIAYGLSDLYTKKEGLQTASSEGVDPNAKTDAAKEKEKSANQQEEVDRKLREGDPDIERKIQEIATSLQAPSADFQLPDIRIYVESVSMTEDTPDSKQVASRTGGVMAKVHIFDKHRSPYFKEQVVLRAINSSDIVSTYAGKAVKLGSGTSTQDAVGTSIEEVTKVIKSEGSAAIIARFDQAKIKEIIKSVMPVIKIGSDSSVIGQLSISSNTGGALANALMIDAYRGTIDPQTSKSSTASAEEIVVLPSTLNVTMLGSPLVQYGQQFYLDAGTGTTLDSIYIVTSVQHSISPDSFTTQMSMTPSYQGSMRSFKTAIKSAVAKLTDKPFVPATPLQKRLAEGPPASLNSAKVETFEFPPRASK